jgi:hypothetical protein
VIRDAVGAGLPDDFVARKGVDLEEVDGVQDMDRGGSAIFSLKLLRFVPHRRRQQVALRAEDKARVGVELWEHPAASRSRPRRPPDRRCVAVRRASLHRRAGALDAASPGQPATPVDLDNDGIAEIVVLSDSAGVFVFGPTGAEWNDGDNNPATILPYIAVPGITWAGPPAFANLMRQ